ncbi:MAG: hypothetical protein IJ049_02360 [Oscillospiraceae bacterium]|nr:hypothetical protein [Oscillospiraceae bacterium]
MHAVDLVGEYRIFMQHFNRTEYREFFRRYQKAAAPYFDALRPEEIRPEVTALLDTLELGWARHRWKFRREAVQEDDKMLLLLYLAPAAAAHGTETGKAFAEELAEQWNARYPGSQFKVGSFADIQEGFRWKPKIPGTNKDLF